MCSLAYLDVLSQRGATIQFFRTTMDKIINEETLIQLGAVSDETTGMFSPREWEIFVCDNWAKLSPHGGTC